MREIKFRLWDKKWKRMVSDLCPIDNENALNLAWVKHYDGDYTVMQFTGLKDSKGVDIYEGDIVDNIVIWGDEFGSSPVIFKDGCFGLDVLGSGHRRYEPCLYEADSRYITVIGNIHETTIDEARDKS